MENSKIVLSIAGSDSGGGAGVQADIKTIAACGCFACTAITAVTAQNTVEVREIHPVPLSVLRSQITAVLDDMGADAVKIGMLYNPPNIELVAELLRKYGVKNIVLDPVMISTSGTPLLQKKSSEALIKLMLPLAEIITPNIPEAEFLLQKKINPDTPEKYVEELAGLYNTSVLLKGGHFSGPYAKDYLFNINTGKVLVISQLRINTKHTHGTGCTLSSAIASFLAQGFQLEQAVQKAKAYISSAIASSQKYKIGKGAVPLNHFPEIKTEKTDHEASLCK
ncbi:MAG: bifunctional hydroxymethylpyrimidine kinase/phosphomethylpyrimidine kinase [Bacteroidia bacterium]|nr:MAG: bifunctional hydroxymethylpyrimidine kinase/phosphomethylpyrimidine kinase [Bacteroidia bacterium]